MQSARLKSIVGILGYSFGPTLPSWVSEPGIWKRHSKAMILTSYFTMLRSGEKVGVTLLLPMFNDFNWGELSIEEMIVLKILLADLFLLLKIQNIYPIVFE